MKQLYTLLILLIPFVGFGQEISDQSNLNSYVLSQQIDNQDLFSKQVLTGKTISVLGLLTGVLGAITSTPELSYVGAGVALVGYVYEIDSYKWLNKSKIRLTNPKKAKNYFKKYRVQRNDSDYILKFLDDDYKVGDKVIIEYINPSHTWSEGTILSIEKSSLELQEISSINNVRYKKIFNIRRVMSNFKY